MLVDVFNGEDLIWTYDIDTEDEAFAEKAASKCAREEGMDYTHTAFRNDQGNRQLSLWDL